MGAPTEDVAVRTPLVRRPERSRRTVSGSLSFAVVRAFEVLAFVAVPLLYMVSMLSEAWANGSFAIDLNQTLLPAGDKLLHGNSPYPAYGYPPLVAFLLVPFAAIPGADIIIVVLLGLSVPAILRLLGVRDWRCYGLAFLWAPIFSAVQTANVTLPIMLCLALSWRFRESVRMVSLASGAAVAAKILAWPAVVWLASTRRWRSFTGAVATAFVLSFGLWAVLGFDGLFGYPRSLDNLGREMAPESYTFSILLRDVGAPAMLGTAAAIGMALLVLAGIAWAGRRRYDDVAFSLTAAACIFASPINWLHSFAFLLLAVAVLRPRLSPAWFLPLGLHLAPGTGNGEPWQTAVGLGFVLVTCVAAVVGGSGLPEHDRRPRLAAPASASEACQRLAAARESAS